LRVLRIVQRAHARDDLAIVQGTTRLRAQEESPPDKGARIGVEDLSVLVPDLHAHQRLPEHEPVHRIIQRRYGGRVSGRNARDERRLNCVADDPGDTPGLVDSLLNGFHPGDNRDADHEQQHDHDPGRGEAHEQLGDGPGSA